jgi:hypothetical protein
MPFVSENFATESNFVDKKALKHVWGEKGPQVQADVLFENKA